MWVRIPPRAPMNETEKKQKIEAFKQKLLLTSKKEIIDLLVEKMEEVTDLRDLWNTSIRKGVEEQRRYENQLNKICSAAEDNAKILEKIHQFLDEAGQIYPDTSLENCVQGLIVDIEFLRDKISDLETRKAESSTD